VRWVELHPEWFLDNASGRGFYSDRDRYEKIRSEFGIRITYLDLHWSNCVSNSHSAPHNGVTNWSKRDEDKPVGYPGWKGRIEYKISHDLPSFGSDLMEGTRIHTGTGGSTNGTNYGFGVSFFADDWPGLAGQQLISVLADKQNKGYVYGKPRYFR
jgi:hypothetical protein